MCTPPIERSSQAVGEAQAQPGAGWARAPAPVLVALVLAAAYLRTLAPGITWANDGSDSGDLVTAAATLGVPHPSGYPTYVLLARLFQLIPLGDLAYRTTLLSAAAAVLAALGVYAITRALLAGDLPGWLAAATAAGAALALGLTPVLWGQAVVAEVYALNALFAALALWLLLRELRHAPPAAPWALAIGLALGNHLTIALLAGLWLLAALYAAPRGARMRRMCGLALWGAAGLLVYAYLPLRAAAHPPINWGDPRDLASAWWVVSGQLYRPLAFGLPRDELAGRLASSAGLLLRQFGWAGLALGLVGLLYGAPRERMFVWAGAVAALGYTAFAVGYNTADSYHYLIPVFMIVAIWAGLGVGLALSLLRRLHRLAAPAAAIGLAALLAWRALTILPQVDASGDRRAIVFAERALAAAPPGALVVADGDLDAFPLWYYHYALGRRPDLAVLVDPLLDFAWYRRNLAAVYPALRVPAATAMSWVEALAAANPQRVVCHTDAEASPLVCDR